MVETRVRWHIDTEWRPLLVEAIPHAVGTGEPLAQCVERVMRHQLSKERWRSLVFIKASLRADSVQQCIEEVKQHLSTLPASAPPATAKSQTELQRLRRSYTGGVRWTQREWTLLAREFDARTAKGEGVSEFLRLLDAQDAVIELERRRAVGGLRKEWQRGRVQQGLAEGRANIWTLKPEEESEAEQEQEQEDRALEMEPDNTPPALPTPQPASPPSEPFAQAISDILARAVADILRLHHQRVMTMFDERLRVFVQGVRSEVHATLEAELGGPVNPSSKPQEQPPESPPPTYDLPGVLPVKQLAVDVVGFVGSKCEEVRKALNGAVDVRFLDANQAKSPGQHFRPTVILAAQFVSHTVEARIKAKSRRLVKVFGNASKVIEAIEQLQSEQSQNIH